MSGLTLRPYQIEALEAIETAGVQRAAVVLPTGMGKTVIFAELIARRVAASHRPLVLVHRDELAKQAAEKIHALAPHLSIGIVKAERDQHGSEFDVVIASVQTLGRASRRARIPHERFDTIIVDECHHATAPSYVDIMTHFGAFTRDSDTTAVGFTATLERGDGVGLGDVWQKVVIRRDVLDGIRGNHLVDVRGRAVTVDGLDLATVARRGGDYADNSLGDALESSGAGKVVADAYVEHASNRQGVLFAPTVRAAYHFADALNAAGITAATIEGGTAIEDRELIYKKYREGEIQVLSNCMVLTEGWDAPWCSCAVIARPTSSTPLYVQMVGRILRPWPGKTDALVLDVVGIAGKLRLASIPDLSTTEVRPEQGESMLEALEREGHSVTERRTITGELASHEVDLFGESTSAWLKTRGGVWFIPTRTGYFFLWPEIDGGDLWKIGRSHSQYQLKARPGQVTEAGWVRKGLPIEYAMAFTEQAATEADPSVSQRTASWRTRKGGPSEAQQGLMARLGIEVHDLMTKSEASDALSIAYASKILDGRSGK